MIDFVVKHSVAITTIATVVGAITALLMFLFDRFDIRMPRAGPTIEQAEALASYREKAIALANEVNATDGIVDFWMQKKPKEKMSEARRLMRETFSIYQEVYVLNEAGGYPEEDWKSAVEEMKKFLSFPYVKENIQFANSLNEPFGKFMRDLEKELTGG